MNETTSDHALGLLFLLVSDSFYFLPTLVVHHQRLAILVLNFLLGWIAALAWSATAVPGGAPAGGRRA